MSGVALAVAAPGSLSPLGRLLDGIKPDGYGQFHPMQDRRVRAGRRVAYVRLRYFVRVLAALVILIVSFMSLIAAGLLAVNRAAMERAFAEGNRSTLSTLTRGLTYQMDRIIGSMDTLLSDRALARYAVLRGRTAGEGELVASELVRTLFRESMARPAVLSLGIWIPDTGMVVHTLGAQADTDFFRRNGAITATEVRPFTLSSQPSKWQGRDAIAVLRQGSVQFVGVHVFTYVEVTALAEGAELSGPLLILGRDGVLLAAMGGGPELVSSLADALSERTPRTVQASGQTWMVQDDVYAPLGWRIVYFASTAPHAARLRGYTLAAAALITSLLAAGVGLAWLLANLLYRPVREVLSGMEVDGVAATAGSVGDIDEFALVRARFREVQTDRRSLVEALERNRPMLREVFLRGLLTGTINPEQQTGVIPVSELAGTGFRVVAFEVDDWDQLRNRSSLEAMASLKRRCLAEAGAVLRRRVAADVVDLEGDRFAAVLTRPVAEPDLRSALSETQDALQTRLGVTLGAAFGGEWATPLDLRTSYAEALRALEGKYQIGHRALIGPAETAGFTEATFLYTLEAERHLINAVLAGDTSAAEAFALEVVEENLVRRRLKPATRDGLVAALTATIHRILQRLQVDAAEVFGADSDIPARLHGAEGAQELTERLTALCRTLCEAAARRRSTREDGQRARMVSCIEENYTRATFSLNDMAAKMELTPTYLSELFKQRIGVNFIDYLIAYRLEKAKELLVSGNRKVHEAAMAVGYVNVTSFIRMFRRLEGVSPGRYKEIAGA